MYWEDFSAWALFFFGSASGPMVMQDVLAEGFSGEILLTSWQTDTEP